MKTKEQWLEFIKKKRIKANKELINADLVLNNEDHFYSIYIKQGKKIKRNVDKKIATKETEFEKGEEYF